MASPGSLRVLYDESCGFCCECAEWMAGQEANIELALIPRGSAAGQLLLGVVRTSRQAAGGALVSTLDEELVVIDDRGNVYEGPTAFLMCLWALREYEVWAYRFATPRRMPYARRLFRGLSQNRKRLAWLLGMSGPETAEERIEEALPPEPVRCV